MKGFTRNKKFIPITGNKKVTRKSRDQKGKQTGIKLDKKKKLPHTSHIEMEIKDEKGKTQGKVEMDVFGKAIPEGIE
jgi:hypothetical protein